MVDHEDYIKLSDKIDGLCTKTQDTFDSKINRIHERVDNMHEGEIRHDERLKTIEETFTKHMFDEDKRWKIIMRSLLVLALLHVLEFSDKFPHLVSLLKSIGF